MINSPIRFPFTPFPDGIFAVAHSSQLKQNKVISIMFMGEKVALFKTKNGEIGAIESYCPHLGANLSLGKIKQDSLQCPFHGLCFKKDGSCSSKNYHVKHWKAFEQYGYIFLIQQTHKDPLNIHFPNWDFTEWSKPIRNCFKILSHPQEILENSVDILHFKHVHHYLHIKNITPINLHGTEFQISYHFKRSQGLLGFLGQRQTEVCIDIHAYGLGLSFVEIYLPSYHLTARQLVLPTPIDGDYIYLRTLTALKTPEKFSILPQWIIPKAISKFLVFSLSQLAVRGFLKDFLPDITIWENKKYISKPFYLPQDGEFDKYRTWAAQFYSITK